MVGGVGKKNGRGEKKWLWGKKMKKRRGKKGKKEGKGKEKGGERGKIEEKRRRKKGKKGGKREGKRREKGENCKISENLLNCTQYQTNKLTPLHQTPVLFICKRPINTFRLFMLHGNFFLFPLLQRLC